jgi:hypothetical protein
MKTLTAAFIGIASVVGTDVALAQGQMMQGGMWGDEWMGGYGGPWAGILLIAVIAVFVVWIIQRKGK